MSWEPSFKLNVKKNVQISNVTPKIEYFTLNELFLLADDESEAFLALRYNRLNNVSFPLITIIINFILLNIFCKLIKIS
jgi:hypothetical protein